MRRFQFHLLFLPLFVLSVRGQNTPPAASATSNNFSELAIPLNGPWKFHIGDNPQWAQPGFDDSGWQETTIDPKHPALTAAEAIQSDALPGWQSHGHPGYTGYAWYRIRLQTLPDIHSLALLMPLHVDDGYEVYVNGQKIGSFGKLDGWHAIYPRQPKLFPIPAVVLDNHRPAVLAIRVWDIRYEALPSEHNMDGGLRSVPLLGSSKQLLVFQQSVQERIGRTPWRFLVYTVAYGAVGILALLLFFFSGGQREYLWAGISLTGLAVAATTVAIESAQQMSIPSQLANTVLIVGFCAGFLALPLAAMYLLCVPRPLWRRANYVVFAIIATQGLVELGLSSGLLPPTAFLDRVNSGSLALYLPFIFLLLAITVDGLRILGRKAWVLLTPGVLFVFYLILFELFASKGQFHLLADIVFVSVPVSVLVIFLMRFTQQQRENARLVDDMKQAQEVQQILIPEKLSQVSGFRLEAVYRPAQQVGGDFFQILPLDDGGLLVIVGDVSGKGTRAAMLVAVIVGAVRTIARDTATPGEVLTRLNTELLGRMQGGFATCLVVRIAVDGTLTLANAGHLGPYINGVEIEVPHNLPLGLAAGMQYEVRDATLPAGSTLVLMTDGVVEAQSAHGELYGFDRTQKISQEPAETIVAAAQAFGQQDDITVVSVERVREADAAGA